MDCILTGSSVRGIFQARILEWVAISFCRGSSQPRDWTWVSRIVGSRFTVWATREVQMKEIVFKYFKCFNHFKVIVAEAFPKVVKFRFKKFKEPSVRKIKPAYAHTAHSSILAWRIPWTEEPGGYSPWGHTESDTTEWLHRHVLSKFLIITGKKKLGLRNKDPTVCQALFCALV